MLINKLLLVLITLNINFLFAAEQNFIEHKEPITIFIMPRDNQDPVQPESIAPRISSCTKICNFFKNLPATIKYQLHSCLSKRNKCTDALLKILPVTPIAIDATCAYYLYNLNNDLKISLIGAGIFFPRAIYDLTTNMISICKKRIVRKLLKCHDTVRLISTTTRYKIYILSNCLIASTLSNFIKYTVSTGDIYVGEYVFLTFFSGLGIVSCCCLPCCYTHPFTLKRLAKNLIKFPINGLILLPYKDFKNGLEGIIDRFIKNQEAQYYFSTKEELPQLLGRITKANPNLIKIMLEYASDIETEVIEHFANKFEQNYLAARPEQLLQLIDQYAQNEQFTELHEEMLKALG